ncbi:33 kDa inner dynein arm light chain, axonemal [Nephila pilipes]|uniref:33 kDa inner dynein arm light chain, axonemal n=1 Tax=Nephila pilipes TaxID=299642 RepID=A0A8X6PZD9_NEPPI|nr:33 kDa inner dynein arm light chain, axonemal [Nephila pilipes]
MGELCAYYRNLSTRIFDSSNLLTANLHPKGQKFYFSCSLHGTLILAVNTSDLSSFMVADFWTKLFCESSKMEDSDSSIDSDEEATFEEETKDEAVGDVSFLEDRSETVRAETIGRILDSIFVPRTLTKHGSKRGSQVRCRKINKKGKEYLLRLSRQPASRNDIIELSKQFDECLKERQVKMTGFCPMRRELYDLLFDELIRQATIHCAERGALLLRIRDEFRMTMAAYEKLFECGVEYGARKSLEAEIEQQKVEIQYKQLQSEVSRAERLTNNLKAQIEAEETLRQQMIDAKQAKHQERMEFLKRLNKQLKEQITYIS